MMMLMRGGFRGGGLIVLLIVGALVYFGAFSGGSSRAYEEQPPAATRQGDEELVVFVKKVLASTEDVWSDLFRQSGKTYERPKLRLFTGATKSGCGFADSEVGPFYCPADRNVYIDLDFYRVLRGRLGAPGDFAQAYVIAHEVGHHVQNLLGVSDRVHSQKGRVSEVEYNRLSVALELQADFYAGVWAHHARRILEAGDIEEGINAASQIGDDALQRKATGSVRPETFTHGSSAQRVKWFKLGFETGDFAKGDTFSALR
jgi:predicted metalloprotease